MKEVTAQTLSKLLMFILLCVLPEGAHAERMNGAPSAPFFYDDLPVQDGLYWGIGTGDDMTEAELEALTTISGQISGRILGSTNAHSNRTTEALYKIINNADSGLSSTEVLEQFSKEVQLIIDSPAVNSVCVDIYKDHSEQVTALFCTFNSNVDLDLEKIRIEIVKKRDKYNQTLLLSSVIFPGSGQIAEKNNSAGLPMLGIAATALTTGITTGIYAANEYSRAAAAETLSVYQYHRKNFYLYISLTAISGIVYLFDSFISGLDMIQ